MTSPDLMTVEMPVEGQNPLAAAGEAFHNFTGRISNGLRSGYEAMREVPGNIKTYAAIGASAVTLFTLANAESAVANPDPFAGENAPTLLAGATLPGAPEAGVSTTPATSSPADQECVQAGLVLPQVNYAYMLNPGRKPYAKNPRQVGRVQEIRVAAEYPALPDQCVDYRRLGRVKLQIEVSNNKWRNMEGPFWNWIYSRSKEGKGGIDIVPTGHEADWYYRKSGEDVRAKFGNQVKNLQTGETTQGKTEIVPVQVRGSKHH